MTTERNFRSRELGKFTCTLTEDVLALNGTEHVLTFKGKNTSERIVVPDYILPEAKAIMKRGGGDKMLDDVARWCIHHEVAEAHVK